MQNIFNFNPKIVLVGFVCVLLVMGHNIWAQNSTPHNVVDNHLSNLQPHSRHLDKAAESFHPDVPASERQKLAFRLKTIWDAMGDYVELSKIPKIKNYIDTLTLDSIYTLVMPSMAVPIRNYNGVWYYDKVIYDEINIMYNNTFPKWTRDIVHHIPTWLLFNIGSLYIWQLLGFFIFILVGKILSSIVLRLLVFFQTMFIKSSKYISSWQNFNFLPLEKTISLGVVIYFLKSVTPWLQPEISVSKPLFIVFKLLIIYVFAKILLYITDVVAHYFKQYVERSQSKTDDQLLPIVHKALKVVIIIIAAINILLLFNINVNALIAGVSLGGLAIALAAQDTVKNLIGSGLVFFDKPFQIGDYIMALGIEGTVEEVGFRSTRIRKVDTSLVSIPNGDLTNAILSNYGIRKYRILETNLGFEYSSDPKHIQSFIYAANAYVESCDFIQKDTYLIYLRHLSSSSIDVFFRVYLDAHTFKHELALREEVIYRLIYLAKEHMLNFAFPSTSVYIEKAP